MFHLSLGSKELFHSNFLEFLWNQDKVLFIRMLEYLLDDENVKLKIGDIKKFLPEEETSRNESFGEEDEEKSKLLMAREEKNFDICIYHKDGKKTIYDVIIENKVKSIPYIEQLRDYEAKVNKNQDVQPIYILLSLATEFPNKNIISNDDKDNGWKKWEIVSYNQLAEAIKNTYLSSTTEQANNIKEEKTPLSEKDFQYIEDYVTFIKSLDELKDKELDLSSEDNFRKSEFLDNEKFNECRRLRLHDMYAKLRGSFFVCLLKEALLSEKFDETYIDFYPGKKEDVKAKENEKFKKNKTIIWLASEMTKAKQSTITAKIKMKRSKNMYEVQVEGENYKHMFNHPKLTIKRDKDENSPNTIEDCLNDMPYFKLDMLPSDLLITNWNGKTDESYNRYKPNVLYKYVKIPKNPNKSTVQGMIDIIVEDIGNILGYIEVCESKAKKLK